MANVLFANQGAGELAVAVTGVDTSLTLKAGQGGFFPAPSGGDYALIVVQNETTWEVMKLTARTGDVLTVVRAQESTIAGNFPVDSVVEMRVTAGLFSTIQGRITTLETSLATAASQITALEAGAAKASWVGQICMHSGSVASIASIPGGVWKLCDGTNGTPNLTDKFVVGAGAAYAPGDVGGAASRTLTTAQLPPHNHGVNDPGHSHGVNDPGHTHANGASIWRIWNGTNNDGAIAAGVNATLAAFSTLLAYTGISIQGAGTGISTQNTGSGAAIDMRPPYYAVCYVMRVA